MKKLPGFLLALALLVLAASPAAAHRPDWGSGGAVTRVEDIQVSYAFYRRSASPDQVDVYTFHADANEFLHAGIQIPKIRGLETYGVSMALFGPGLPPVEEAAHADLPEGHPEDQGALLLPTADGEDYFEPFTMTRYEGRQEINQNLPEGGDYTLLVWHPEGQTGKYVLDIGRREQFGLQDLFLFPVWWVQARLYFEQGWMLLIPAVLLPAWLLIALLRRRRPA